MDLAGEVLVPSRFRHVLLPLDGSAFAAAALPTARALVARFGARLVTISIAADGRDARWLLRRSEETLADLSLTAAVNVLVGTDPAAVITAHAEELTACVVCMSTRGRGRVAGALIGSVARGVLQRARAPVVAVGPLGDRPPGLVGRPRRRPTSWPEPLSIRRLVACVDGSQESEAVLPEAARWSLALGMRLSILTVAEDAAFGSGDGGSKRFGPDDPYRYVDGLAEGWGQVVAGTVGEVVFDPIGVASGLRARLAARPAGLVSMTTHARRGLERVRLGATAADIVRIAPAPALVVPLPDDSSGSH